MHLLPSLVVEAVSQAPSPKSNPNSPLLIVTMSGQYILYHQKLIGQKYTTSLFINPLKLDSKRHITQGLKVLPDIYYKWHETVSVEIYAIALVVA